MPQTICTRPYEWFEIHRHGDVFLCCPAWLKRPIGNLLEQSIEDIWNGVVARELRKSVINGSFHNCSKIRCPFLHKQKQPVQQIADIVSPVIKRAITGKSGALDYPPQKLNLCFDHRCNLACPSCRQQPLRMSKQEQQQVDRLTAIIKEQLIPHSTEVTMSGFGDPFASPAYLDILTCLDAQGEHGAQLRLHSNGQLWTEKRWAQFPHLQHRVRAVEISIDAATEASYQLNRPGGTFANLLKNLEFMASQPFELTLSMVVQNNNYTEIPAFIALAQRLHARVYLSQLVNWGTFSRADFINRAVHLPDHSNFFELTDILRQVQHLPHVDIGNLSPLTAHTFRTNSLPFR